MGYFLCRIGHAPVQMAMVQRLQKPARMQGFAPDSATDERFKSAVLDVRKARPAPR
jgi:hypothetical protein